MSKGGSSSDLPVFIPDRAILNWVSVVAGYDDNNRPTLCARLVLMQDASIYAVHHCFCGFGEVIPFNILARTNHGTYQRNGLTESVIVIPHFKSQDAKINMTSPIYKAANQDPLFVQIETFDSFNDYFISRKFLNLDNTTQTVNMIKTLGIINNHGNTGSQQRYMLQFDNHILELPLNISTTTGLGARIASTNYGEVRVGNSVC
jgi:hypothetical protein